MKRENKKLREFEFTLIYKLKNEKDDPSKYVDKLYEVGCDDALVAIGKKGMIALDFTREAQDAYSAFKSAMKDIKKAIPDSVLVETSPDFVTTTDLSKILKHSRQNSRKLMSGKNSPIPVHVGSPSFWHLSEVFDWLKKEKNISRYGIDKNIIEVANVAKKINYSIKVPEIDKSIKELIAE